MKLIFFKLFILCIIFFTVTVFPSQKSNTKIDSITVLIDQFYNKGNIGEKDLSRHVTHLYYLSKETNYTPGVLSALVEESRINFAYGNFNMSLIKIAEGIKLAKSTKDYNRLCHLLLVCQRVMLKLDRLPESKYILKKCIEYNKLVPAKSDRDVNDIYIILGKAEHMVNTEGLSNNMNLVLSLKKDAYLKALRLDNPSKYTMTIIRALQSLAWSQALFRNLPEAKKNSNKAEQLLMTYPNDELIIRSLMIKGAIENLDLRYDQAIENLSLAISKSKQNENNYNLYEIYPMLSVSYAQLGDLKPALKYSWLFKDLSDSIHLSNRRSNNSTLINNIRAEISPADEGFSFLEKQKRLWIALFSIVLIVGIFLFFKRGKFFSFNSNNLKIKNEEINEIDMDKNNGDSSKKEVIKNLVDLAKLDINVFYVEFNNAYPTFNQALKEKYPELTIYDLNFCSLIKMNFESKQIALFTNTTIRSAESRRYRILKKMNIRSQSDLYIMISKLS